MSVAPESYQPSSSGKPPISSMIMPGIGGVADLFGLFSGMNQQSQQDAAMTQTGDELQSLLGSLTGEGAGMVGNYNRNAVPALNSIISSNPAAIAGYQGGAAADYNALGSSPYPGEIMGAGAGAEGAQLANAAALENWHGLQPKELGEATTVASDAAESAARTMKAQMGGVANPGAAFEEGLNTAAQAGMQTGAQLGAMAQEQELGAKEAAGQEYGQVAGEQIGQTEAAGQLYGSDLASAGQGLSGLSEQDIQELESALGTEAGMAQSGMGAQEYGASDWTSLLESELGMGQNQQNPFSGFASGLTSLLPFFGLAA